MNHHKKNRSSKPNYFSAGIVLVIFMVLYWLFDVLVDVFVFHEGTFLKSFFSPDPMCLAMRLINLPIILICFFIAQWMYYKRKAAEEEIKMLRDIIPICSFCKSIRNDEGYFEQIEKYMYEHSHVDLSHTICPTCLKENYPEEYEDIIAKTKKTHE
jgi:hypothetical protein